MSLLDSILVFKICEFFAFNRKLLIMAMLASKDFTAAKQGYLQWRLT